MDFNILILFAVVIIANYFYSYKSRNIPVLIVYVICGKSKFSVHLSDYPVYELRCNYTTNFKDIYEAGLLLDFMIKIYNNPLAEKYIFCQGHDLSYHYRIFFWDRVKYITSTSYFYKNDYGGLYCNYVYLRNNTYLKKYASDIDTYLLNKHVINDSIFDINIIFPACATFFISHTLIIKNRISLYKSLRNELTNYVINHLKIKINKFTSNKRAAVYMEFYWGILFGRNNSTAPIPPDCLNKLSINK